MLSRLRKLSRRFRPVNSRTSDRFERLETRSLLAAHIAGDPTVYATIQAAVDAALPNSVINVDAGSYAEQVSIFKPLTINGARAGSDARSNTRLASGGAGESVLTGTTFLDGSVSSIFRIGADNVTIDGFTLQGQTSQGDTTGAALVILPNISGTHLFNNIFQNNVAGVFLSNSSDTNATLIQHNVFKNNNNPSVNSGRGIYTNGSINGGILTNVTIDGNWFTGNLGDPTTTTGVEAAVALQTRAAESQHDIRITNNVFDNNGKALLTFSAYNLTITGNTVTYSRDQWSGALRFEGGVHDVAITGNTLYANTGPSIRIDNKGMEGANYNFSITANNFWGNGYNTLKEAIQTYGDQYVGTLVATNNWFGSTSGPGGDFSGTGDRIYSRGAVVSISPWATTPFPINALAYTGLGAGTDALIQVEDCDHGGEGVGYHDLDAGNNGGIKYRGNQGVDIQTTTDAGGGYNIGYVKAGEWLQYSMLVAQSGTYDLGVRVANTISGGTFHFELDGVNITGAMVIPNTGAFQTFKTITRTGISLSAGAHTLRLVMDTNASSGSIGNFNWFKFTNTTPIPAPVAPSNLVANAIDTTKVSLTWADNSNNEYGFIIERKTGAAGAWGLLTTTGASVTGFIDLTAVAGTSYFYRVRATGAGGDSLNSNEATATTPQSVVYLSDIPWVSATNDYGPVEKDMNNGPDLAGDGEPIKLNGVTYTKGLGTHALSQVVYNLNGGYSTFQSDIGLDDHQTAGGSVVFQVFADNVKIYDSGVMGPFTPTKSINLNVTGVNQLKLVVTDAGDGTNFDWADWAGAFLVAAPPQAPATPAGLTASAVSWNQVDLSWSDVNNETGFKIERSTDNINFTQIGTTGAGLVTYSDTTAVGSTQYYYRVRATNNIGDSGYSNVTNATTPAQPTVPAVPGTLSAAVIAYNRIDLSWGDVATETGYKIERSLDNVTFTQIGTTNADQTTYSDTTASGSTQYFYRVRATNAVGDSTYTNVANATTPAQPQVPANPSGLAASAANANKVDLSWSDVATETGFKIERSTDNVNFTQIGTTGANVVTYSDTAASGGTLYYYRVRATNAVGDSGYSNVANATTPGGPTTPAAPSNLVATAGSSAQIALAWTDNASNEDGFRVERSTDGVNFTQIALTTLSSYMDQAVVTGTKYYYRVQAYNNVGPSGYSNVANATVSSSPVLPAAWSQSDIGSVGATGSATYSNGVYTVKGAGSDIAGNKDAFHYVYQQITGDATIIVRVLSVQNTDNNAKAGVMFRNTLSADSKEAGLFMTPSNGIKFLTRTKTGGSTAHTDVSGKSAPYWLKLVRVGDTFKAYRSSDGVTWTKIGEQSISMNSTIYVGLAVTSKKSGTLNTSTFDNVSIV